MILDHENGEFSLLAHFRKGSLAVKKGDRVEAGQTLGACGNSGNSSEPHLHYHLQDAPEFPRATACRSSSRTAFSTTRPSRAASR